MEPRVVIGFDPGPTRTAWALVSVTDRGAAYLDSGTFPSRYGEASNLLTSLSAWGWVAPLRAVIETPRGVVFNMFRGDALLQSATVAGMISAECVRVLGGSCVSMVSADDARKAVGVKRGRRKAGSTDKAIKAILASSVGSMPKRSNPHTRDAIVVAVAPTAPEGEGCDDSPRHAQRRRTKRRER